MLRADIGAVHLTGNVVEADDLGGNGLTQSMERKRIVPFVELACGVEELLTTDSLSPNIIAFFRTGTPR